MIEFVYFDAGGVLIKDFSGTNKWEELLEEIGVNSSNKSKFDEIWLSYSNVVCTTFDVDSLLPILSKELAIQIPSNYSLLMGFVNRFEKNEEIWPVVSKIASVVPVGMLTNMYLRMKSKIDEAGLFPRIEWQVIVDSSVEQLQKPDSAIYEFAEKQAGVDPHKILFIDNTQAHLDSAKKRGWQTFLFDPKRNQESCDRLIKFFETEKNLT